MYKNDRTGITHETAYDSYQEDKAEAENTVLALENFKRVTAGKNRQEIASELLQEMIIAVDLSVNMESSVDHMLYYNAYAKSLHTMIGKLLF